MKNNTTTLAFLAFIIVGLIGALYLAIIQYSDAQTELNEEKTLNMCDRAYNYKLGSTTACQSMLDKYNLEYICNSTDCWIEEH